MVFVPVDVVKERLQVQRPSGIAISTTLNNGGVGGGGGSGVREAAPMLPYRGSADTLKTILRTEGLRGIYKVRKQRARCSCLQDVVRVVCSPGGLSGLFCSATGVSRVCPSVSVLPPFIIVAFQPVSECQGVDKADLMQAGFSR